MKKQKNVFIKLKKLALIMSIGVLFSSGAIYGTNINSQPGRFCALAQYALFLEKFN